jgi:uncharacterized membrane protein YtjA (UPF0391 family)
VISRASSSQRDSFVDPLKAAKQIHRAAVRDGPRIVSEFASTPIQAVSRMRRKMPGPNFPRPRMLGRKNHSAGRKRRKKRGVMLSWTITFLIIALIAAVLGFAGLAGMAAGFAKILFAVFLVLFVLSLLFGRKAV